MSGAAHHGRDRPAAGLATRFARWSVALLAAISAFAEPGFEPDPAGVAVLGPMQPHWIWVNDRRLAAARLFDGSSGRMLGLVTTSNATSAIEWNVERGELLDVGSFYSRGSYGARTDVVQIRALDTLLPIGEVVLPESPPKIANGYALRGYSGLIDGGRLMVIYNFSPVMSVSVVDVAARRYAGEILTAGCGLVLPAGRDAFLQICGDGTVQRVDLDSAGRERARARTRRFFDAEQDPVMDRPSRDRDGWWFASYSGRLFRVSAASLAITEVPPARDDGAYDAGWRPGGRMPLAVNTTLGRLFVLMHRGGENTHENAGTEVWVYDIERRSRIGRFALAAPALSIAVSPDADALLFALTEKERTLDVYTATDGAMLRSIESIGVGVSVIQAMQ